MPRALARSAYGTSRRIGEAGISVARLESLTLLNAIPLTFALCLTSSGGRSQIQPEPPRIRLLLGKIAHRIYQTALRVEISEQWFSVSGDGVIRDWPPPLAPMLGN